MSFLKTPQSLKTLAMNVVAASRAHELSPVFVEPYFDDNTGALIYDSPVWAVKYHLPKSLYHEYLEAHLSDHSLFWEEFLENFLECTENDILTWDMENLSVEQAAVLKYYPYDRMCSFVGETAVVLKHCYIAGGFTRLCKICACKISPENDYKILDSVVIRGNDEVPLIMRSREMWCQLCRNRPLFKLYNADFDRCSRREIIHEAYITLHNGLDYGFHNTPKRNRLLA